MSQNFQQNNSFSFLKHNYQLSKTQPFILFELSMSCVGFLIPTTTYWRVH